MSFILVLLPLTAYAATQNLESTQLIMAIVALAGAVATYKRYNAGKANFYNLVKILVLFQLFLTYVFKLENLFFIHMIIAFAYIFLRYTAILPPPNKNTQFGIISTIILITCLNLFK